MRYLLGAVVVLALLAIYEAVAPYEPGMVGGCRPAVIDAWYKPLPGRAYFGDQFAAEKAHARAIGGAFESVGGPGLRIVLCSSYARVRLLRSAAALVLAVAVGLVMLDLQRDR